MGWWWSPKITKFEILFECTHESYYHIGYKANKRVYDLIVNLDQPICEVQQDEISTTAT